MYNVSLCLVDCISRLSGSVKLTLHYTTLDISCRYRRYECDSRMNGCSPPCRSRVLLALSTNLLFAITTIVSLNYLSF